MVILVKIKKLVLSPACLTLQLNSSYIIKLQCAGTPNIKHTLEFYIFVFYAFYGKL